nr:hypothetical protein [Tanacetum cinerariifolium]
MHLLWDMKLVTKSIKDPAPVAADFNAQDYATLLAHPFPFQKFSEAFLCLVGLSRHYTLDDEIYPLFLHKNREGGNGYLCFHPYLGSYQRGEQDANIQPVVEATGTAVENVALVQPRCQGKRKSVIVDAGGVSHPPKKLMEDYGTSSGISVGDILHGYLTCALLCVMEPQSYPLTSRRICKGCVLADLTAPSALLLSRQSLLL